MKVLFAASECYPFVKTGGLADVISSLPRYLNRKGVEARVVLPCYAEIAPYYRDEMITVDTIEVPLGWRKQTCHIKKLKYMNVVYYFIDNNYYFNRSGLYGHEDEAERFAFFSRAVLEMLPHLDFKPDILHCNDWQTGPVCLFRNSFYRQHPDYQDVKTVFTIHNLKYQGIFPRHILGDILGLDDSYFNEDGVEYHGQVNFMKAGLNYADIITTVSETYAEEIKTPEYGEGLDGLLRKRADDLYGIVNGIDYDNYNPLKDPYVFVNYRSALKKKQRNKVELQKVLNLPVNKNKPMFIIISRLVEQKGFDLIEDLMQKIIDMDMQMVVLGTGSYKYEQMFKEFAWHYPEFVSTHITFNEDLARKMHAAGDFYLMPSRFEPCGTGQLIALRYLSVPIVRQTGGLADTVKNFDRKQGIGNGFSFSQYNSYNMYESIKRAVSCYRSQGEWKLIRNNIKECDNSWEKSAEEYIKVYNKDLKL